MTAEKRRRRALIDALPWDPEGYLYPGPWRLDRRSRRITCRHSLSTCSCLASIGGILTQAKGLATKYLWTRRTDMVD
jgi:hypothetical protein